MVDGQLAVGPRMCLDRLRNAVQRSDVYDMTVVQVAIGALTVCRWM